MTARIEAMDEATYRALPGVSGTAVADILRSPAKYRWRMEHPTDATPAMLFGTLVHALVLEQEHPFVVSPDTSYRTQAARDWRDAQLAEGRIPVMEDVMLEAHAVAGAVRANPDAAYLLNLPGESEVTVLWDEDGVPCKGRLDRLAETVNGGNAVIDLKTTRSLADFQKSIGTYGIHSQVMHYRRGVMTATGDTDALLPFLIVVETEAPYLVQVFQLSLVDANQGDAMCQEAYRRYADCTAADVWPSGVPEGVTATDIPAWSARAWDQLLSGGSA